MPKLEIEIDDKGEFVGALPTEFDAILQRIKSVSHGEGFGKGNAKAAEEAKQQIADAIKSAKMKMELEQPLERQKWAEIDERNKLLSAQVEQISAESRKQLTAREEVHATETTKRVEALKKRESKIQDLVNSSLRIMATQAGARDESLSELEVILQHRIGFDDDMEPYVKGEDGQPAKTVAGNPLGIPAFVQQYLDNHPHHRKPTTGRGGDARRGASLSGHPSPASIDAAKSRYDGGDRSPSAINDIFEASRKKTA